MQKEKYGLFTAITMITGIVIGSGIFFKSDDVLWYTNGNMILGIIVFCIAAVAIIFGCLSMSQLAMLTNKPGGIVTYAEDFIGRGIACAFGWFQMLLYFPTLVAVVSWVAGMYICQLFGWPSSNLLWTAIGFIVLILIFSMNMLSAKLGGMFQNASMIIKLIPLLLIAIFGMVFGNPGTIASEDIRTMSEATAGAGFLAALAPIAFSMDGWIVSTSIGHEIKNSKRNLPLALIIAPILILIVYVAYFVGITSLVGVETVLAQKNESVFTVANMIVGHIGAKMLLVFVIISVLGTVNGLTLGFIRTPYSLALRKMVPRSNQLSKECKSLKDMPINSAVFSFFLSVFWLVVHYYTQEHGLQGDVSEIAVTVSYLNYVLLYVVVIRLTRDGTIKNKFMGYVAPILAIIGSLVIVYGSKSNPIFLYSLVICYGVMGLSVLYYYKNKNIIL